MCTDTVCTSIDAKWLRALECGDQAAWERLVQQWTPALMRFARMCLGNEKDAEDVVQQVWFSSYKAIIGTKRSELCRGYFYRAVRLAAGRLGAKLKKMATTSLDRRLVGDTDSAPLKDTIADERTPHCSPEYRELVERAMGVLNQRERAVIVCRVFKGITLQKTADNLNLTIDKVRYAEDEAIKKMRGGLGGEMGESGVIA